MASTPSPWPKLDELLRELEEIAETQRGGIEPALNQASLAVSRATTALTRAVDRRKRPAALERARELVEEARQAIAQARLAIAATDAHRTGRTLERAVPQARALADAEGDVETACPLCRRALVVRYRAIGPHPVAAFPVACPAPGCHGMAEVEYPVTAIRVDVELLAT